MVQGALFCARICPGTLSRRWYANPLRHIGHEGGGRRAAGLSRYRLSRLICGHRTSAMSGNWEPAYPACRALLSGTGQPGDTVLGSQLRRSVGRRVGGCGAQSEYIKVRSVVDNRAESAGGAAGSGHRPAGPAKPVSAEWSGLPSRCHKRQRREQQAPATRLLIVCSSVIWRSRPLRSRNARDSRCEPARAAAPEDSAAVSRVSMPRGMAAQAVGDSQ
jgi:hypothetical protein